MLINNITFNNAYSLIYTSIWVYHLQKIMENYSDRCQGSFIEINEASIVWQYKDCELEMGTMIAEVMIIECNYIITSYNLTVIRGRDFIKIKPKKANLCSFSIIGLNELLNSKHIIDRIIYIGNDMDKSMKKFFDKLESNFGNMVEYMKKSAGNVVKLQFLSISVGQILPFCKYSLSSSEELKELFDKIVSTYHKQNKLFL